MKPEHVTQDAIYLRLVSYVLQLRPSVMVEVALPIDLTRRDVKRLTRWLRTLPLEGS